MEWDELMTYDGDHMTVKTSNLNDELGIVIPFFFLLYSILPIESLIFNILIIYNFAYVLCMYRTFDGTTIQGAIYFQRQNGHTH